MFFFFSSRRRHTRCSRDWSSDVCSSDLKLIANAGIRTIFYGEFYRDQKSLEVARRLGIELVDLATATRAASDWQAPPARCPPGAALASPGAATAPAPPQRSPGTPGPAPGCAPARGRARP